MSSASVSLETPMSAAVGPARRWSWTRATSYAFTLLLISTLLLMLGMLAWQSLPVWRKEGLGYLTGVRWFFRQQEFGALPMIYGTLVVSAVALLLAGPVGIGAAVFTSEVAPSNWRLPIKLAVELLAGVPSVIYGLLGILFLRNWVYSALQPFEPLSGDTLLTAGLLLAMMILPTVTSLADDALAGVPAAQRHAARALGMTRAETVLAVTLPQARGGLLAALLLALGRALGEGIAVFMVIGRQDNQWPENLFSLRPLVEAGQAVSSKLVSAEIHLAYGDPLHWSAMVSLGMVVLVLTSLSTWLALRLSRKEHRHASRA